MATDTECESNRDTASLAEPETRDQDIAVGIWCHLGELPPGAIVSEAALARIFGKHPVSIKRAVRRGELPPPTRLLGGPVWTVAAILRHLEARLDSARKKAEATAKRLSGLSP